MTILFIIVAIAFTVAMTVLMIRPFSIARQEQLSFELLDEELREIESLVARKVALVQALRDIEYDWTTNKISKQDYERFKRSCERQAVGVMRRLDAIHGGERDFETIVDRAVADRLNTASSPDEKTPPADGTTNSASKMEQALSDTNGNADPTTCTTCGNSLEMDDRFCSQCGTSIESPSDEASAAAKGASDEFETLSHPPEVAG